MTGVLSLVVLTIIALLAGAAFLWRRNGKNRQSILLLILAAVMAFNVAIWTWPVEGGDAPIVRLKQQ